MSKPGRPKAPPTIRKERVRAFLCYNLTDDVLPLTVRACGRALRERGARLVAGIDWKDRAGGPETTLEDIHSWADTFETVAIHLIALHEAAGTQERSNDDRSTQA